VNLTVFVTESYEASVRERLRPGKGSDIKSSSRLVSTVRNIHLVAEATRPAPCHYLCMHSRPEAPIRSATGRISPRLVDAGIVAVLLVWALPDAPWPWRPPGHVPPLPRALAIVAILLIQTLPFLWRRRYPGLVLLTALGALAARWAMGLDILSATAAAYVAAYSVGRFGAGWVRWVGRALAGVAVVVAVVVFTGQPRIAGLPYAMFAALLLIGEGEQRRHEAFTSALVERATLERLRIARELHDILAHQLSLIALQAGAARLAIRDHPKYAADAISTIETTAREGAGELTRLLGVLRHDADDERPPLTPEPDLSDVEVLVAKAHSAGLPVQFVVDGTPSHLSSSVQTSVYRIVQEAITNVVKHAGNVQTSVLLRYRSDALVVEVVDEGKRSPERSHGVHEGHGLAGMAERVASFGGRLDAGPRPVGGFSVRATIPCGD
jgi:signal transduction histidine kinase